MGIRPFHYGSLFTGMFGLDLGIELAIPNARCVVGVEREAYACATLVRRMEEGCLDPFPLWSDAKTFDGKPWRGRLDAIVGGFPCQDISNAGNRVGIHGERSGLWFEFARIIGEVRPRFVFLENVGALLIRGIDAVLGSLAELGFDAEWCVLSAKAVGAPHVRKRVFILAHATEQREREPHDSGCTEPQGRIARSHTGRKSGRILADSATPKRRRKNSRRESARRDAAGGSSGEFQHYDPEWGFKGEQLADGLGKLRDALEHAESLRREQVQRGQSDGRRPDATGEDVGNAERNGEPGPPGLAIHGGDQSASGDVEDAFPPGPGDLDRWAATLTNCPHLAPAIEPGFRVLVDGLAYVVDLSRVDQLRGAGNGVVPLQAAVALRVLAQRFGITLWSSDG